VGANSRIRIVGNRGDYSALVAAKKNSDGINGELWLQAMHRWLRAKAEVYYLLVAATHDGRAVLEPLAKEYRNFHLKELTPDDVSNSVDKAYVKELLTFHIVLLEDGSTNARAMWIEREHLPGSITANNCEFVAPRDATTDVRFDEFAGLLDHLISCTD
jgi:hypothetical protein